MATDTVGRMSPHLRGLTVTTIAATVGLLAGVASNVVAPGEPRSQVALGILAAGVVLQFPLLHVLGIEYDSLGAKDKIYITFMTFALWFVSWGILLTSSAL